MKFRILALMGTTAAAAFMASAAMADTTPAAAPPPPPSAAPYPAMSADISMPAPPTTVDLGFLGKVSIGGVVSALAYTQSNPVYDYYTGKDDQTSSIDLSNAQIFINKSDGVFQYFIQAGAYTLPSLGTTPNYRSPDATKLSFGSLPQAFVKIVPNSTFSVEAGNLPTLIGDEYTFTFENLNIERGLLWGVEPAVSRGVQGNFTQGPIAVSVAWTDGFYSGKYNTISGLATWTISSSDTLAIDGQGPTSTVNKLTYACSYFCVNTATVPWLANEQIYNIMYTHTMGQWIINPYLQYTSTPASSYYGYNKATSWGAALLVNYAFDAKSPLAGLSIPVRVEYISTTGSNSSGAVSLLFGPGSNAWSFTVTPTYQFKNYFVRAEVSYVAAGKVRRGDAFGDNGEETSQTRGLIETGVAF